MEPYILNKYKNVNLLLQTLLNSCIQIKVQLEKAPLYNISNIALTNLINTSGDIQKPLDIYANDLIIENICKNKCAKYLYSEELEDEVIIEDGQEYTFCFDPLDGSSNIDCNVSIGTIFSIYNGNSYAFEDILLAGYVIYGFSTELILTFKNEYVMRFVYDAYKLEWLYVENIIIPKNDKKIYCINHGNENAWHSKMHNYIDFYRNNGYTQRYVGSMVADIHRTLLYGGIFSYPTDLKNKNGKLRLLYECIPMSMIIENAGGLAIDEDGKRICEMNVNKIHQKTGIIMGSKEDIKRYIDL
jgi:fructose-1,6-bisphosphatase I